MLNKKENKKPQRERRITDNKIAGDAIYSGDVHKKDSLTAASFTKKDICNIVFHTQQVCFFGRACPGLWLLPCLVSNNNMPKNYLFCRFLTVPFVLLLNRKQAGSTRPQLPAPLCTARGTACTQCTL